MPVFIEKCWSWTKCGLSILILVGSIGLTLFTYQMKYPESEHKKSADACIKNCVPLPCILEHQTDYHVENKTKVFTTKTFLYLENDPDVKLELPPKYQKRVEGNYVCFKDQRTKFALETGECPCTDFRFWFVFMVFAVVCGCSCCLTQGCFLCLESCLSRFSRGKDKDD